MKNRDTVPFIIKGKQLTEAEKKEQQYQESLEEFLRKNNYDSENPDFDEDFYIKRRIKIVEDVLIQWEETADFEAGRELDGKELIDGNLITTKTGTVDDFLFAKKELKFLQSKKEAFKSNVVGEPKQPEAVKDDIEKPKLSLKQIALKLVYESKPVTKENANEIAKEYLHNSGHKLYQEFNFYSSRANRLANTETKKTLTNKIDLFKSVIDLLIDKEKAIDELKIIQNYLHNY